MLFNSLDFFWFFLATTTAYFLLPLKGRQIMLLLASCWFYMAFIPKYILILLATILVDYFAGLLIVRSHSPERKKFYLWTSIVATCLILFVFKYFNFFRDSVEPMARFLGVGYAIPALHLILPIGLSFHTFQSLSYVIEVYRGNQKVERNFLVYALYVMFYPQLVAGPIERPQNILHQFHTKFPFDLRRVIDGLKLMAWGLFKKVVIADHLVMLVDKVYAAPEVYTGPMLVLASVFFAFQIYCDFSGYSDMAIGAAQVLGFDLLTNFDKPYFSKSISEFWRRWHISLSTWFKDYVFVPLGGSRGSEWQTICNLMVTFTVSGLWHGANFTYIAWGALNGLYLVIGRWKQRLMKSRPLPFAVPPFLSCLVTFCLIDIAWVFFRARSITDAWIILRRMPRGWDKLGSSLHDIAPATIGVGFILIVILLVAESFQNPKNIRELLSTQPAWIRWPVYVALFYGIFLFWSQDKTQFIYFQF